MSAILDSIMLGAAADEGRFRNVIDAAIESKEVFAFPAFRKAAKTSAGSKSTTKRKAKVDKVKHGQLSQYCIVTRIEGPRFVSALA